MKRTLLIGLGLFLLFSPEAFSSGPEKGRLDRDSRTYYRSDRLERDARLPEGRGLTVRGKRGRKYARRFSLVKNLKNDKLRIYKEHGYTPQRLGYKFAGKRTERWKYYSLGVEYLFDQEGHLIETRHFPPEGNHID